MRQNKLRVLAWPSHGAVTLQRARAIEENAVKINCSEFYRPELIRSTPAVRVRL